MSISDDELIAFLLGDATEESHAQITEQLAIDSELRQRLDFLRTIIGQVDSLAGVYEPPSDLVESTLDRIDDVTAADSLKHSDEAAAESVLTNRNTPTKLVSPSGRGVVAIPRSRSSIWDSTVLTISLSLLCCLALPAVIRARFESRKSQCEMNLQQTGWSLFDYAMNDPENRFPRIADSGPESFSGIYAVRLHDAGMLENHAQLLCPSLPHDRTPQDYSFVRLGNVQRLHRFSPAELMTWQQALGGDYAYNLGVWNVDHADAPQLLGRSHFAILGDAPLINGQVEEFVVHDGRGINILYEDGSIRFIRIQRLMETDERLSDDPFRNERGDHQVGIDLNDASLAPSQFPPLGTRN